MRATPNLTTWRPCDATETAVAWKMAIQNQTGPTALILTRQGLPSQPRSEAQLGLIEKGGYVLVAGGESPELTIIATGSEVELAMQAANQLKGYNVRVVSMPSCELFDAQDAEYKSQVLPSSGKRMAIEAATGDLWYKYVGLDGEVISMEMFTKIRVFEKSETDAPAARNARAYHSDTCRKICRLQ